VAERLGGEHQRVEIKLPSSVMNACGAPLTGDLKATLSSAISFSTSGKRQCACTSMVLTRLPFTLTGNRCPPPCCARRVEHRAAAESNAGRSDRAFEEISACGHFPLLLSRVGIPGPAPADY